MDPQKKKKNRVLTSDQLFDLRDHLSTIKEAHNKNPRTWTDLAAAVSETLGFEVAPTTIAKTAERVGLVKAHGLKTKGKKAKRAQEIQELKDSIEQQARLIEGLRTQNANLALGLAGEKTRIDQLLDLVTGQSARIKALETKNQRLGTPGTEA